MQDNNEKIPDKPKEEPPEPEESSDKQVRRKNPLLEGMRSKIRGNKKMSLRNSPRESVFDSTV